jgi:hypothetical protein
MFWNKKTENEIKDPAMLEIGREVERGLLLWWSAINNHWEDMKGNAYHQGVALMMDKILKDKTLTDADRIEEANKIISLVRVYRNRLKKVASVYNDFIGGNLNKFEKMLDATSQNNKEREWIKLSWDLCKIREKEITAIENHIDTDEFIPNIVISDNGASEHQMTEEENSAFAHKLAMCQALRQVARDEENKIEPNRSNIAQELFGKLNDYMKDGSYSRLVNEFKN